VGPHARHTPRVHDSLVVRAAIGILLLAAADFVYLLVGFGRCTEPHTCAAWHDWLNGVAFFGLPVLALLGLITGAFVVTKGRRRAL
jgi:hypothetical protein